MYSYVTNYERDNMFSPYWDADTLAEAADWADFGDHAEDIWSDFGWDD
jgi:hypothetical protein